MDRSWVTQLRKGVTELTVLAALRSVRSGESANEAGVPGEAYGYELLRILGKSEPLATTPATLYPVLARLTEEKQIAVREQSSPNGPPRRYYRLTPAGEKRLHEMERYWDQLGAAMAALLGRG